MFKYGLFWKDCIVYSTVHVVLALQHFLWYKCCSYLKCWAVFCWITQPLPSWQSLCQVNKISGTRGRQVKYLLGHLCPPVWISIYSFTATPLQLGWLGLGFVPWRCITRGCCILTIRIKRRRGLLVSWSWIIELDYVFKLFPTNLRTRNVL